MSCNYAEGLSEYENKGRLGAPEKFDTVEEVKEKVEQLVQLVKQAKHIGRAAVQTQAQINRRLGLTN
jgi:mono-ADP-ribosyltransferase sirtuin 6